MKTITVRRIAICFLSLVLLVAFPYIANGIFIAFNCKCSIDASTWNDIIAIAIPSGLTILVIWQSAQQQTENAIIQQRMEAINAKMLHMELESGIGYLRPYFSLKDAGVEGSNRQPYPHKLNKYISLVNSGENDFFITSVSFTVNEKRYVLPCSRPVFISKQSPYNVFSLETGCLANELDCTQIDMEIELILKTIKGFQYKQVLFIGFENSDKVGIINKFNIEIQEMT